MVVAGNAEQFEGKFNLSGQPPGIHTHNWNMYWYRQKYVSRCLCIDLRIKQSTSFNKVFKFHFYLRQTSKLICALYLEKKGKIKRVYSPCWFLFFAFFFFFEKNYQKNTKIIKSV